MSSPVAGAGLLPSYQRIVSGVQPAQLFSRRSFRPREKYLILLVFLTFGIVCFGAFFFLPEDFRANGGVNSVYRVYQRMQKAGPELLIPAPPRSQDDDNFESNNRINAVPMHHGDIRAEDPHLVEDKLKLQAKIDEEYQNHKTLEKPELAKAQWGKEARASSSTSSVAAVRQWVERQETVPAEPADKLPLTTGGEDRDPVSRMRRDKVKK
ncbi:mannosyl-oligosaccharide alpha-1,2-mannosidase IA-like, partial [Phymastichus coffea]|uniref:mannosyl-oligosaccharide alpha-1,2-mannosidase IA-like n=1 Tax=Phymastichus coffea TaxID=108790 RepID=UPI00273B07BF